MSEEQQITAQSSHGEPPEAWCCLATMEDITNEAGNYVEYQSYPSLVWLPAPYEQSVIEQLLEQQYGQYIERVRVTDCQAELGRLLASGPPIYLSDPQALPLAKELDTHISMVWYASDNVERSAKLQGAIEGLERQQVWDELKNFLVVDGSGDD